MAGAAMWAPVTDANGAAQGFPIADGESGEENSMGAEAAETVITYVLSNEAPGNLVDYLIAQGHGSETMLQVLAYLKSQSNGHISDAFYNQVAAAPPGSEVFTSTLSNYAGLVGGIEICGDGTLYITTVRGVDYIKTGYSTWESLDDRFLLTHANDAAHYIYTHGQDYGGGVTKDYYAFGIAWKPLAVTTIVISNEAPGHLVDYLINNGHGSETLLQVLNYLKARSGGIISDAFYGQVAGALPGSEVFTATLSNYAGLVGGIEIGTDGTISIPDIQGKSYINVTGYATVPSQDRQFTFTYAQDEPHYIYTHSAHFGGGVIRYYYAFAIVWKQADVFLPLIRK
jgi:hypothetical protein